MSTPALVSSPSTTKLFRDLVYGVSGSGKTTWFLRIALSIYETTGRKTRWYLGDGGGETILVNDIDDFIEVMPYNLWDHPLETTQKICEGWWPQDPREPNSKLLPPSRDELKAYGLFVYEGLTVMADYIMGDRVGGLAERMSKGEMLNNDASFRIQDGALKFGGNSRGHYGFTQRRMVDCIERTRALPVHVGWTAHERKVEDEDYKEVWIGPDIAGKLLTTKIGASFGNTIHLQSVKGGGSKVKDPVTGKMVESIVMERRAYLRTHYDPEGTHYVKYYANTRLPIGVKDFPEWLPPDPLDYYRRIKEAKLATTKDTNQP